MPEVIQPLVSNVMEAFGTLDGHVLMVQMTAARLRKGLTEQSKVFKAFLASCGQGLADRLKKIKGVKPEKLKAECDAIIQIVDKYYESCTKFRSTLPKEIDKMTPIADMAMTDMAMGLRKINELLQDLKKKPNDDDLKNRIADAGKIWSNMKSNKESLVASSIAEDMKGLGSADKDVKTLEKLRPYFTSEVLTKFLVIDKVEEQQVKPLAAKIAPLAAALVKKASDFRKDAADGMSMQAASGLVDACTRLDKKLTTIATG